MFAGKVPPPLAKDAVKSPAGTVPQSISHHMLAQKPMKVAGGQVRITDSSNFPVATTIAAALVDIEPGGCASSIGTPTPTSGNTTSAGRGG